MEWIVGKKYKADNGSIRTCLLVYESSVVLSPLENIVYGQPKNEPVIIHTPQYLYWEEYKEPVILKAWIPVVQWKDNKPGFTICCASVISKSHAEESVRMAFRDHKLIDVVEVTWEQK